MSKREEQSKRVKKGIQTGVFGLITNFILVCIKLAAGFTAGSVSILADAVNSVVDTASSILTIGGFFIANKPADKEHPYGHQRAEYISALFVSVMILLVGFEFLFSSVKKILNPSSIASSKLVFVLLIISIVIKVFLGIYYSFLFKKMKTTSSVISALIKDSFNDAIMTSVIILSYFIEIKYNLLIDGYVGAAVAIYILYSGIDLIIETSNELLGSRPNVELVTQMQETLDSYDSILGYHDLIIHSYGPNKMFISVDIEIDSTWSLIEAHKVLDKIERDFEKNFNTKTVCHLDPVILGDPQQMEARKIVRNIIQSLDGNFKFHDFQIVRQNDKQEIHFDVVVPNSVKDTDKELFDKITKKLTEQLSDYKFKIEFDRYYILDKIEK